jgi:hypothetical protein
MATTPKPPTQAEAALAEAQALLQLWLKAKGFLAKATTEDPITREEEQVFLETKSAISKYQRTMINKVPPDISFGADKMQDILRQSISINHLRGLPKADKQTLAANWHHAFIHLNRAMGCLQFLAEGFVPPPRVKQQGSGIKDMKGAAASKEAPKKKGVLARPGTWIFLALAGGAVWYVMNQ